MHIRIKRQIIPFLLVLMTLLTACGAPQETPDEQPPEQDSRTETELPEEPEQPSFVPDGNVNPLTGLCDGISDQAIRRAVKTHAGGCLKITDQPEILSFLV